MVLYAKLHIYYTLKMPIELNYVTDILAHATFYIFSLIYMSNLSFTFIFNFDYMFFLNAVVGFYFYMIAQHKNQYCGDILLIIMIFFTLFNSVFFMVNLLFIIISPNNKL